MRIPCAIGLVAMLSLAAAADEKVVSPIEVVALDRKQPVAYDADVEPVFEKKCFVCHSGNVTEGDLDLSSHAKVLRGGGRGPVVRSGKPSESLLIKMAGRTAEPHMPPPDEKDVHPLTPAELALIRLWIEQGAKPPAAIEPKSVLRPLSSSIHVVRALAVAPDKSFIVAGRANQIHVYDAAASEYAWTLADPSFAAENNQPAADAHLSIVESLAVSPDSRWLASGSYGEVALWDFREGRLRTKISGFAQRVVAVDFSPDGRYLAAVGGAPTVAGEIKVFDVGQMADAPQDASPILDLQAAHSDTVFGVAFSPDGGKLATCGADMSIKIFEFPSGKSIKNLEGHTHHVLDVAWQDDGALLASAGADMKVRLWDYETGEQLTKINRGGGAISTIFLDHDKQVNRLAFVGDTTQILSCSGDQPARLWQLTKQMRPGNYAKPYIQGGTVREFGNESDYLYAASASLDGALVATGGRDGVVWLYAGGDGKLIAKLVPPDELIVRGGVENGPSEMDPAGKTDGKLPIGVADNAKRLAGHRGFVNAVAWSPDGKLVASASCDHTVGIWEAASGKELRELSGHSGYVRSLAFSPDGGSLASAGADQKIKLWNIATGRERATLWGHIGDIYRVAFAGDDALYSASRDGTIKVWDVANEQAPQHVAVANEPLHRIALSPDENTLASAGSDGTIRLWDIATGKPRGALAGHTGEVMSVAFSADGARLVSGSADTTVRIWDVATAKSLHAFDAHEGVVYSAVFSPDGKSVASAGGDQLVKLWNADSGDETASLKGHGGEVYFVDFSPDGLVLASASHDLSVKLWDPKSGKEQRSLKGHQGYVRSLAFSPDGKSIATASADRTVKLWELSSGKAGKTLSGHTGIVFDLAFSSNGKTLASAAGDETIKLWNVESGDEKASLNGHRGDILSIIFSSGDRHVVSAGEDGIVRRWSTKSGKPPRTLNGHRDAVYDVAVSPDRKTLASCSFDGAIKLWHIAAETDKPFETLTGHTHLIRSLAFSPNGTTLASASYDKTIKLWDIATKKERATLAGHENMITAVVFSPDGNTIATAGFDRAVRLWDAQTGEQVTAATWFPGPLRCLAYSPNGETIAIGGFDKSLWLWQVDG